jgi:hypothetical protein
MADFGRVLRTGLSRLRRLAASRLAPTGFNPSRKCNIFDEGFAPCPRHGRTHRMTDEEWAKLTDGPIGG